MHLMLDFETLGTGPDSVAVSLGAVAFNKSGIVSKKYFVLDVHEQIEAGRKISASTLAWWMKQSEHARLVFQEPAIGLEKFFKEFEKFIDNALGAVQEDASELKVWGNGANFDISLLEDLYRKHHARHADAIPWKYWNVWCFRTFDHLTGCKAREERPHGTHHNALDDAVYQTNCVMGHWRYQAERKKLKEQKKGKK